MKTMMLFTDLNSQVIVQLNFLFKLLTIIINNPDCNVINSSHCPGSASPNLQC